MAKWSTAPNVEQTSDGGYIASMFAPHYLGDRVWLWKVDANGATLWCKPIDSDSTIFFLHRTPDGNYALAGMSYQQLNIELMKVSSSPPLLSPEVAPIAFVASGSVLVACIGTGVGVTAVSRLRKREAFRRRVGGGKKGEFLRSLSSPDLMKLAKAAPGAQVTSEATTERLVRIVKRSFSIEEMKSILEAGKRGR